MLWRINVQREDPARPNGFSPNPINVLSNDSVFWVNEDHDAKHQPYPTTGTPGAWGGEVGPGASSEQLNFPTGTTGTFTYKCGNHPDEFGTIVVANTVVLAEGANPLFAPVTVTSGQCLVWGNSTGAEHQPCPDSGSPWFTSAIQSGDVSAPITFDQASGTTISYHCVIHPDETGSVTIK